jgi:hypothetical protein
LQDAALAQRGTRGFGTSAEPNAARYSDFSPHFLSTLSALRLTSPVDADNLCRCESYSVTMPPNVGQPQYMPPQQPPQQYQQQYLMLPWPQPVERRSPKQHGAINIWSFALHSLDSEHSLSLHSQLCTLASVP